MLVAITVALVFLFGSLAFGLQAASRKPSTKVAITPFNHAVPDQAKHKTNSGKSPDSSNTSTGQSPGTPTSPSAKSTQTPKPSSGTPSPASTPAVAPTLQNCTKDTSYQAATALNISASAPGLTQTVEQPHYYTVYGYTASQVRTQLNQCSGATQGASTYDALTNWWTNFAYNYYAKSSGLCALKDVAVGEHITFEFPQWSNTVNAEAGLNSKWQTYMSNLTTHEHGHRDLALQYSSTLYSGLVNFPDTNCGSIVQSANDYGNGIIASLNQVEANYDAQTNHGATQGATFP